MAAPIQIQVGPGPRGGTQTIANYGSVKSLDLTWSWGARPASALVEVASDDVFVEGSALRITVPVTNDAVTGLPVSGRLAVFYGIIMKAVGTDSSEGQISTLEFHDMREFLNWDVVFGFFNKRDDLLIPNPDLAAESVIPLVWSKRYAHMLPQNVDVNLVTYTDGPYSAGEILDFIFNAPTVNFPWERLYQEVQYEDAVYNIDCSTGRKLADVLTEISQIQGLVFTLLGGPYQLVWALKGDGSVPADYSQFPANSDHRRLGTARSGLPDSVTVFGARNRYQLLNIPMVADWNQQLINPTSVLGADFVNFESVFINYVFLTMSDPVSGAPYKDAQAGDPQNITGNMLAKARAETITLGEFADFLDAGGDSNAPSGEPYRDRRKFNGRTRLNLPVLVYVKLLVFRAFALPGDFSLMNADGAMLGTLSCHIIPTTLVETTYDFVTGQMTASEATVPGGNGLAIVQGFNFFTPPPQVFRSDKFDLSAWLNTQKLWQRANFQIDDTGDQTQFIIFDEPVAVSNNLMSTIDGHGMMNAQAAFTVPAVLASLCVEAEPFSYYQGVDGMNAVQNVTELNADYVTSYGQTTAPEELPFADGQFAAATNSKGVIGKAPQIANYILEQQPVYVMGGYTNRGNNGTQLSGVVDRVNLKVSAQGMTEEVDFTTERAGNTFEPERDFERKIQLLQLAPGQAELRDDARATWGLVAALRHNPKFIQLLIKAFHDRYGSGSPLLQVTMQVEDITPLNGGTPLWSAAAVNTGGYMTGLLAAEPEDSDPSDTPVFVGATVRDQESTSATQYLSLQRDGLGLVRVMGPANVGDSVGMSAGNDYLVSGGTPAVGTVLQAVPDSNPHLVQVQLGAGAGGGGATTLMTITGLPTTGDCIICNNTIAVAMPYKLRPSVYTAGGYQEGPFVAGATIQTRTTPGPYNQRIEPPYRLFDQLQVSTPTGGVGPVVAPSTGPGSGGPITMLDSNDDGREWATQLQYCDGVTLKTNWWAVGDYPQ
jgi:hypothetical protein